ncbi:MAG: hypothetical protein KUA37_11595 [Desulfomicrobium sp.]|uniref:SWIM zinc finger family protein n=1 Tax=Hoeflea sp. TaxID=1940281 RepID=UPI0025C26A7C|nr:hypothetical protein [Hoeflea sp.]MBU4529379.1 hypothetical protein [Alphaproteobacteria bacterium]MBV1712629.1 hypothetical protein [Desulfomicrobium sp.]MBU4544790.1 hypothetical protein [Alphaproteobacteria bacterium]MBU4548812.1 hypothetical protein [Alphaproteobacteria bacterium]MBV1785035.1 hypothetical protein [Hoeflea sp.]
MKDPAFGQDVVRALATVESFTRGRDYVRRGAVSGIVRRGDRLTAEVEGSELAPYTITIKLHDGGVAGTRCTCAYEWGGVCKHVVAVLLKYLEAPGAVAQRPSLDSMLEGLDRAALVTLLVTRAEADPALALWFETELAVGMPGGDTVGGRRTTIDPELIRRQAEALLSGSHSRRHRWRGDEVMVDEERFSALIDKARPFLEAGDGRNALEILVPVMEALVPAWREQADWDETLHEFFPVLGEMIAEAVLVGDLPPEQSDDLMVRLDVWQGMLDDYGLDDYLQVAIDALEQGWDEIGLGDVLAGNSRSWPPTGRSDWATERLTQARLRVLDIQGRTDEFLNFAKAAGRHGDHAAMLVRLERISDAVAYARKRFRSAEEVLQLARLLMETGQIDAALDIATWGLELRDDDNRAYEKIGLARWLRDSASLLGRKEAALKAARLAFEASLSLEDFKAAAMLAGPEWTEQRPHLLASLAAADHAQDRTEIYLSEDMIEEAVRSVDLMNMPGSPSNPVLMRLAKAAHASHPEWVIEISERMAAGIMETGQSGLYELAAECLENAALAYDAADRYEDWIANIDVLIAKHRRKHKLRPLLAALRPGE